MVRNVEATGSNPATSTINVQVRGGFRPTGRKRAKYSRMNSSDSADHRGLKLFRAKTLILDVAQRKGSLRRMEEVRGSSPSAPHKYGGQRPRLPWMRSTPPSHFRRIAPRARGRSAWQSEVVNLFLVPPIRGGQQLSGQVARGAQFDIGDPRVDGRIAGLTDLLELIREQRAPAD